MSDEAANLIRADQGYIYWDKSAAAVAAPGIGGNSSHDRTPSAAYACPKPSKASIAWLLLA